MGFTSRLQLFTNPITNWTVSELYDFDINLSCSNGVNVFMSQSDNEEEVNF